MDGDSVHVCVWSHVCKCAPDRCQKKSGTTDITPSAERRRRGEYRRGEDVRRKGEGEERRGKSDVRDMQREGAKEEKDAVMNERRG